MKSEERSQQNCRCQETSEMPALHAQICYTKEFYDRTRLTHRKDNFRSITIFLSQNLSQNVIVVFDLTKIVMYFVYSDK